jgi:hypothetical protein
MVTKDETATMTTSEASIPEPPNVFIYNKDTKDAIPNNVTHVKVDPSVKEIHAWAFEDCCESLVEVEFSEGLEVIGDGAFWHCSNLKHINKLPSTLKKIGDEAFRCCASLDSIEFPEGLQVIGEAAFEECGELKRIKIPSAHVGIGEWAFQACDGLVSVELPEGLQGIGGSWFSGCKSLTTVNVPSSVIEIQDSAFSGCRSLASLDLPEGLQSIGKQSFLRCEAWTHARIPSNVKRIEPGAFAYCTRLISLELPEGLEVIDLRVRDDPVKEAIFRNYGCPSLMNLVIPSEQHFAQLDDDDDFMKGFKLRTAASNFDDLVGKLQHRFDALPVHRLCYYQSYYPLTEAMENLQQNMDADPSAGTKVDSFGMTPFHILALSQTPNLSLFQALLAVYQVDIICTRDKFGSTPIDYLFLNYTHEATTAIQSLLPTILVNHLHWLGLVRWQSEDILTAMDEALAVEGSSRRRAVGLLSFKLATYEKLESMSLLELALWKVKLIDGDDRQSWRINSGAEVVISNVLPFLDKVCRHDYYSED